MKTIMTLNELEQVGEELEKFEDLVEDLNLSEHASNMTEKIGEELASVFGEEEDINKMFETKEDGSIHAEMSAEQVIAYLQSVRKLFNVIIEDVKMNK